jgi:hypothetical protein
MGRKKLANWERVCLDTEFQTTSNKVAFRQGSSASLLNFVEGKIYHMGVPPAMPHGAPYVASDA